MSLRTRFSTNLIRKHLKKTVFNKKESPFKCRQLGHNLDRLVKITLLDSVLLYIKKLIFFERKYSIVPS